MILLNRHGSVLLMLIFILSPLLLFAHEQSTIKGKITDAESGEGLMGVNVVLEGTVLGAATGPNGSFEIHSVPAGEYEIIISHIGYETVTKKIIVAVDEVYELNMEMRSGPITLSSVLVEAEPGYSAASQSAIRQIDMELRPVQQSQQLLLLVPGLFIAQHNGGGKAEQIFLRGFDTDHGTDINIEVDGMPVNMVTHGHGQGYADLHFLIPEIVEGFDVLKGPYFAKYGNLATSGSVVFKTMDHFDQNQFKAEGGMFNSAKLTGIMNIPMASEHNGAFIAGQYYQTDGPFDSPLDLKRINVYGKFHSHLAEHSKLTFSMGAFTSAWDASGQIPDRAVKDGTISRFGAIDDMEGGNTSRYNMILNYKVGTGTKSNLEIMAYGTLYDFRLYSNFTFWLNDAVYGDMIEQTDHRSIWGGKIRYGHRTHWGDILSKTEIGGGVRFDQIDLALWKSPDRTRLYRNTDHHVAERNAFLWINQELVFNRFWRMQLGLRGEYFTFDVTDHLDNEFSDQLPDVGLPRASGYADESELLPKLSIVFSPVGNLDFYLNAGVGFHSNDARDVIVSQSIDQITYAMQRKGYSNQAISDSLASLNYDPDQAGVSPLPLAYGGELGLRWHYRDRLVISAALWGLKLDEELVFVGDEGTTEISGPTRRLGIDLEARWQISPYFWFDVDLSLADSRYEEEPEGQDFVPLSPIVVSQGGLSYKDPTGFEGSLRYRYIADRPANEDNSITAIGSTVFTIFGAYNWSDLQLYTYVENIFDTEWNEAQFDTESRLFNEAGSTSELNFTPGNPFNVWIGVRYIF